MAAHEEVLQTILLTYLRSRDEVIILGEERKGADVRIPVISFFVVESRGVSGGEERNRRCSQEIVQRVEEKSNFAIRSGHLYSKRLLDEVLKVIPPVKGAGGKEEGVVRVSLVHYNTGEFLRFRGMFPQLCTSVLYALVTNET